MRRRSLHIWWAVVGVAIAGVGCVWVLIHFSLLPMRSEIWMDLYTGNLRIHKTAAGLTVQVKPWRNFSAGMMPGANLATYKDPLGREEWIRVADSKYPDPSDPSLAGTQKMVVLWPCMSHLIVVTRFLDSDPRPGFKYDPPNGYSRSAKRKLLLNCLQIARETRDAELITQYYHYTVEMLRPLEHKAYEDDLPDVAAFIASNQAASGN